jgi:cytochrome c-type biogenesis protein CcmH
MRKLLAFLLIAACTSNALAAEAASIARDPVLEARVMRIAAELRCLVCQNQTVADSDAALAKDLRAQARAMLAGGADDDAVRRFMTDRYGDFVLYRPPLKATTLPLWLGPGVLFFGGLAALAVVLRRRERLAPAAFDPDPSDLASESGSATLLEAPWAPRNKPEGMTP